MTKLRRPISRELEVPRLSARPIVVEIDPETKEIRLHEKGCRTKYSIGIAGLYVLLVRGKV